MDGPGDGRVGEEGGRLPNNVGLDGVGVRSANALCNLERPIYRFEVAEVCLVLLDLNGTCGIIIQLLLRFDRCFIRHLTEKRAW